jgi:hypothetical protein
MLIGGGAVSEKHGAAERADALQPAMPSAIRTPVGEGEAMANQLGWTTLLTRWLDVASQRDADTTSSESTLPGQPGNLALSRGLAFLLDLEAPL